MQVGISISVTKAGSEATQSFSVAGASELEQLWKPIIERRSLYFGSYIASTGLTIDPENHADVAAETRILADEIESTRDYENDLANPVFRCRRSLNLVDEFPPMMGYRIYIG